MNSGKEKSSMGLWTAVWNRTKSFWRDASRYGVGQRESKEFFEQNEKSMGGKMILDKIKNNHKHDEAIKGCYEAGADMIHGAWSSFKNGESVESADLSKTKEGAECKIVKIKEAVTSDKFKQNLDEMVNGMSSKLVQISDAEGKTSIEEWFKRGFELIESEGYLVKEIHGNENTIRMLLENYSFKEEEYVWYKCPRTGEELKGTRFVKRKPSEITEDLKNPQFSLWGMKVVYDTDVPEGYAKMIVKRADELPMLPLEDGWLESLKE